MIPQTPASLLIAIGVVAIRCAVLPSGLSGQVSLRVPGLLQSQRVSGEIDRSAEQVSPLRPQFWNEDASANDRIGKARSLLQLGEHDKAAELIMELLLSRPAGLVSCDERGQHFLTPAAAASELVEQLNGETQVAIHSQLSDLFFAAFESAADAHDWAAFQDLLELAPAMDFASELRLAGGDLALERGYWGLATAHYRAAARMATGNAKWDEWNWRTNANLPGDLEARLAVLEFLLQDDEQVPREAFARDRSQSLRSKETISLGGAKGPADQLVRAWLKSAQEKREGTKVEKQSEFAVRHPDRPSYGQIVWRRSLKMSDSGEGAVGHNSERKSNPHRTNGDPLVVARTGRDEWTACIATANGVAALRVEDGRARWPGESDSPWLFLSAADDRPVQPVSLFVQDNTLVVRAIESEARGSRSFVSTPGGEYRLFALDLAREGALLWEFPGKSDSSGLSSSIVLASEPVVHGSQVFVLLESRGTQSEYYVGEISLLSGKVAWRQLVCRLPLNSANRGPTVAGSLEISEGRLYCHLFGDEISNGSATGGSVLALDAQQGTPIWAYWIEPTDAYFRQPHSKPPSRMGGRSLCQVGGWLYVLDARSQTVTQLDALTGKPRWTTRCHTGSQDVLGFRHGRLLLSGSVVSAVDAFSGRTAWRWPEGDPIDAPIRPIVYTNRIAVRVSSRELVVLDTQSGLPMQGCGANSHGSQAWGRLEPVEHGLLNVHDDVVELLRDAGRY